MVQPLVSRVFGTQPSDPASGPPDPPPTSPRDLESALAIVDRYRPSPILQSAAAGAARPAIMQQRLDSFRAAMTPTYRTPEGDVTVPTPFGMSTPYPDQIPDPKKRDSVLDAAASRSGLSGALGAIVAARGSPEDIRSLTQALIDGGQLSRDSSTPLALRVRQMMFEHRIGVDCAGYVQRAYLHATGTSRAVSGFVDLAHEDLGGLGWRGFTRIQSVSDLQAGDIGALGPPPGKDQVGHRVIVYDQHVATPEEVQTLLRQYPKASEFVASAQASGSSPDALYVVTVDSSWGSGGNPAHGGVDRRTWWYNQESKQWGWTGLDRSGSLAFASNSKPYDHPLIGFFRGPAHVAGGSP
jgi:hypothetical protein